MGFEKCELPLISICSRNQFSQRDADKIMEMEEWRGLNLEYYRQLYYYRNITLNATEFMSIFRNFAMYKMDPNEIENFTEDQKEFLGYHRIEFSKLIEHQVINGLIHFGNEYSMFMVKTFYLLRLFHLVMN